MQRQLHSEDSTFPPLKSPLEALGEEEAFKPPSDARIFWICCAEDFGTLRPCTDLKQIESFGMVSGLAICGDAAVEAGIEGVAPPEKSQLQK